MKCDTIAERRRSPRSRRSGSRCRWSCASRAPTSSSARRCSPRSGLNIIAADDMADGAQEDRRSSAEGRVAMSILVDKQHAAHRPGHHRRGRRVPRQADAASTARRSSAASRPARAAPTHRGLPGLRHRRARRCEKTGANAIGDLRAAARAPPTRSSRRPTPASRSIVCITEGIPVLDMVKVQARARRDRPTTRSIGPELPRRHHAGRSARSASCPATSTSRARSASSRAPAR